MRIPTTVFEVMTMLSAVKESDKPSKVNPSLTVSQSKEIMINAIKGREKDFTNSSGDILMLINAMAVIYNRKPRGLRADVRNALANK